MTRRALIQRFSDGRVESIEVPEPAPGPTDVVVRNLASLVSAGTERMLLDFGRANLVGKARQQPGRVTEAMSKLRADGLGPTVHAIRSKLDAPTTLGYASAGVVLRVGSDVRNIDIGDLVATNGNHADVVVVPQTFCARIPPGVSPQEACFATIASIALQGIRLSQPEIGASFAVIGLGLIGLLAVQLLLAQGCAVLGIDTNTQRLALARQFGAEVASAGEGALSAAATVSGGRGVDGVIICATTKSNDPVREAAQMCRPRGKVVLVGDTGLNLERADFYRKEISFQVSCSYGPGRYEPSYEAGYDYPLGVERWTAGRNMSTILHLIASGRINVTPLITRTLPFDDAPAAYDLLLNDSSAIGIVLEYQDHGARQAEHALHSSTSVETRTPTVGSGSVGVIGAGHFAREVLIPAIAAAGGHLAAIASRGGTDAAIVASRYDSAAAITDVRSIFDDPMIDTIVVSSRHDSHATYVVQACEAGKHVFVEKPLATTSEQLEEAIAAYQATPGSTVLGIGFNRRFAPLTIRMRELLSKVPGPKALILTMNAGSLDPDHWTRDPTSGGGRIIGEAIHLIDLARFLVAEPITATHLARLSEDTASITLTFADQSIATVHYFANGSKRFPKERIEVFAGGRVLVNNNFRSLRGYGFKTFNAMRVLKQDKGHATGMQAFFDAVRGKRPYPIPFGEIVEVHRAVLSAVGR